MGYAAGLELRDIQGRGANTYNGGHSKADFEAKVKSRGAEFMTALRNEVDSVIVLAYMVGYGGWADYDLMVPFIDGLLSVAKPGSKFVDGQETGYSYYSGDTRNFLRVYASDNGQSLRQKYGAAMQIGFPLYWNPHRGVSGAPSTWGDDYYRKWIEHDMYFTELVSDQYVWIFTEGVNWLKNGIEPLTDGALRSGRSKLAHGDALGYNMVGNGWNGSEGILGNQVQSTWNTAPSISITDPVNGAVLPAGTGSTTVRVSVTGAVNKVELYRNSVLVGTKTAAPFDFTDSGLSDGAWTFFAMAYPNAKSHMTSNIVTVDK